MSVVGFDIGNENCVIAVVKQRGIDVLLNDESKRETPAVVCFGEKQRFLGSSGAATAMMNPRSTVTQVKRLIGRMFNDPEVNMDLKIFPFETSEAKDGTILINLKYLGETQSFAPVQILAMLFSHLKDVAEKNLEMPVVDCVIGIPSYFTDLQRRAYMDAARIAGLKPLRLMHDCAATALSYGIYKTDFSNTGPTYVAFIDIGHCDTQVSIVSFEVGHMRVMSHAFESNLGGRDFDEVLFGYFAAQFKEYYKIDVYSNLRASIRLRAACEKLKKVLSANSEAPLNIECLMEEIDVKSSIKRDEFERLSSGLLERVGIPCKKALHDAGVSVGKIHSVELVGSGSRIPAIAKLLTSLFGREPSRTINASECVARGCALQCAMLSPVFRVREYDIGPFQSPNGDKARVKVKVQLNLHGIVTVESATVSQILFIADSSTRDRGNRRIQIPDRTVEQAKEKKNALESYVYEMRNKLVDPVEIRYKDEEARAQTIRELHNSIAEFRALSESLPYEDRELIMDECNKAEHWVRTGMQQQESMPKDIDPVLWSRDIKKRTEDLNTIWKHILRKRASPANSGDSKG
ncbi:Heat shock 70 kDa protein 16 [Linum perenne]